MAAVGTGLFRVLPPTVRRADLAQEASIGSDSLLVSLMFALPRVRVLVDPPGPDIARGLGLRTGERPPLTVTASTSHGWQALGAIREARWIAAQFLRYNGVEPAAARRHIRRIRPEGDAEPRTPMVDLLRRMGVLGDPAAPEPAGRGGRLAARIIPLLSEASPELALLEEQAIVQAVRLDQFRVTTAHLVLAALALHWQMRTAGLRRPGEPILGDYFPAARGVAVAIEAVGEPAAPRKKRALRSREDGTVWTESAARAADRARAAGAGAGCPDLLRAALTETDDAGRRLISGLGLDPAAIG